jgi:hypothetical protein
MEVRALLQSSAFYAFRWAILELNLIFSSFPQINVDIDHDVD